MYYHSDMTHPSKQNASYKLAQAIIASELKPIFNQLITKKARDMGFDLKMNSTGDVWEIRRHGVAALTGNAPSALAALAEIIELAGESIPASRH
jgi:hypothetical protein